MYTNQIDLILNQIRQDVYTKDEALSWFESLVDDDQYKALGILVMMIRQSYYSRNDSEQAIINSGLKPTYTPCVLVKKGRLETIIGLPNYERIKSFKLLIEVFKIAEERRLSDQCKNGCDHWWHKDLSNEKVDLEFDKKLRRSESFLDILKAFFKR